MHSEIPQQRAQPGLAATTPLLLLPVRLETRFMPGTAPELWLRIYPDQISIDSHQIDMTQAEIDAGIAYWDAIWRAGKPPANLEAVKGPWRTLASSFTPQRAAWIAQRLIPQNVGQQPPAPVPDGIAPQPPPQYPPLQPRTTADELPPRAVALPDRWTVITYSSSGTRTLQSAPVRPELPAGLTPGGAPFPADLPVDEGMRWLVDFSEAEKAGMAVRIPLTPAEATTGLDRVIVYGVRAGEQKFPGEFELAALLEAHHYTDGLAFAPQGQPTNNTPDADSGYSRADPDNETSFAVERQDPLTGDPKTDGPVAARLLGVPTQLFDHVQYADGLDQEDARQAAVALWSATLGYFMRQVMADVFTPAQISAGRQWFCANVRPRGQLPAFRVGNVPYGVLPVTSLRFWAPPGDGGPQAAAPTDAVEAELVSFVRRALPVWLASSAATPRVGGSSDPDQDLVGILGMDASSMAYRARRVLGDVLLWQLFPWLGFGDDVRGNWWGLHLRPGSELLRRFGYPSWDPKVIRMGMSPNSYPVTSPTVVPGPLSETGQLPADAQLPDGSTGNYIRWLRQASVDDIRAQRYPSTGLPPDALLYHLLRQSLLLEYATQAGDAEVRAGRLGLAELHEAELVNISPTVTTLSPWQMLDRPALDRPTMTWAQYLHAFQFPPGSPYGRLDDLRTSLDWLATRPTAALDRLLTETLDACSHRLDCWATALAASLLTRQRPAESSGGLHLGAFGWAEDLRPAPRPPEVTGAERAAASRLDALRRQQTKAAAQQVAVPLQPGPGNGGFIYAPSLAQATTSAVLRNGYLTHRQVSNGRLLAIDLSSARTRTALWIMDAVRQGQPLGAVLGYRFERALHELDRDRYVQPFRDRFPLVAGKLLPSAPGETVAASNVVDGLRLQRAWAQGTLTWDGGLPGPGSPDQPLVITALRDLDDATGALSDLAIAEAVHQLTLGNYGRAGSVLDAMSRGDRPLDPQVVTADRAALDFTHRVLIVLAGGQHAAAGWNTVGAHARAQIEPRLNTWLSHQLPNPRRVRCSVTYQAGGRRRRKAVTLAALDFGPLDLLAASATTDQAQAGELEQRIMIAADLPPDATGVAIDFTPGAGFISFPDTLILARSLRELVGAARPLEPKDLLDTERRPEDTGGAVDLGELHGRLTAAVGLLDSAITGLTAAITSGQAAQLREALQAAAWLGTPAALPSPPGQDAAGLTARAHATLAVLQQRKAAAGAVPAAPTAAQAVQAIAAIFGGTLTLLPLFTPPDLPGLTQAFAGSAALTAGDDQAVFRWLQQLTPVRPAVSRLDTADNLRQLLTGLDPPVFTLAQLPPQANDRWLGLTLPAGKFTQGRVSLAARLAGDVRQPPFSGLLVDEWPERIPTTAITAGVAFHYEEPRSRAPQSLLLAVCPDARPVWDDELLRATLEDTLDLLRVRTVDLDSIQEVGQILPALYFPFNLSGETVSFQPPFARAT